MENIRKDLFFNIPFDTTTKVKEIKEYLKQRPDSFELVNGTWQTKFIDDSYQEKVKIEIWGRDTDAVNVIRIIPLHFVWMSRARKNWRTINKVARIRHKRRLLYLDKDLQLCQKKTYVENKVRFTNFRSNNWTMRIIENRAH